MADPNIDFYQNTMKVPHNISGTDLYWFQMHFGVKQNGYDAIIEHLSRQSGNEAPTRRQDLHDPNKTNQMWVIYKKPKDLPYDKFVREIKEGKHVQVGNTLAFLPYGQKDPAIDSNGNILLKSLGSDLGDIMTPCGDVLLGSNGEILAYSKGSYVIKPCNQFGFYPIDIFESNVDKKTKKYSPTMIVHNWLDANGSRVTSDNIIIPKRGKATSIQRTFFLYDKTAPKGQKEVRSNDLYPTGYAVNTGKGVHFYPSAAALLIENRQGPIIVDDETPFLDDLYVRKDFIEPYIDSLGKLFDVGQLTKAAFDRMMEEINKECNILDLFEREYMKPDDFSM